MLTIPTTSQRIVDTLDVYHRFVRGDGMSVSAAATYVANIRHFAAWLDDNAAVTDITSDLVTAYRGDLTLRGQTPKTVGLALTAIRSFCRWAVYIHYLDTDPTVGVRWPKMKKRAPRALKEAEHTTLFTALEAPAYSDKKTVRNWERNRRAIFLMYHAGTRISEAASAHWSNIDLGRRELLIEEGKGGKDRRIAMNITLVSELERVPPAQRVGFVCNAQRGASTLGAGVTVKSLHHIFQRWLPEHYGIKGISAHRLRHSFATDLLRHGANLEQIRRLLGHESLETTQIYLDYGVEDLHEAVQLLDDGRPQVVRFRRGQKVI